MRSCFAAVGLELAGHDALGSSKNVAQQTTYSDRHVYVYEVDATHEQMKSLGFLIAGVLLGSH